MKPKNKKIKLKRIKELLENGETKLILPKTKSERKLFATDEFIKQLKKLFVFDSNIDLQIKVISKGINTKIISKFIGHSDVKTTMHYIKPTDDDVKGAMIR